MRRTRIFRAGSESTQPVTPVHGDGNVANWLLSAEEMVPISALLPSDSPRTEGADPQHVRNMAEAGTALPPIVVHRPTMRVIDGTHRFMATQARGERQIAVRYFDGDELDAFVLAVQANVTHGLPLSARDRAAAALRIIRSHPTWSDRAIAVRSGLSDKAIKGIRASAEGEAVAARARVGRDGRSRPIDGAAGRLRAREWLEKKPDASNREIAQLSGISPATARDVRKRLIRGESPLPASQRRLMPEHPRPAGAQNRTPLASGGEKSAEDFSEVLESLMRDPSLKLTDNGRILLRALGCHRPLHEQERGLAEAVPRHRAGTVGQLARTCAALWIRLAEQAEQRAVGASDVETSARHLTRRAD